jgi:pimeloyl-ACP methyl ester carboxylesterase
VTALALIDTGPSRGAFIPPGPVNRIMAVPVVGQTLWRLPTDSLVEKAMSTGFSRPGFQDPELARRRRGHDDLPAFTPTSRAAEDYLTPRALPDRPAGLGKPLLVIFGEDDRR